MWALTLASLRCCSLPAARRLDPPPAPPAPPLAASVVHERRPDGVAARFRDARHVFVGPLAFAEGTQPALRALYGVRAGGSGAALCFAVEPGRSAGGGGGGAGRVAPLGGDDAWEEHQGGWAICEGNGGEEAAEGDVLQQGAGVEQASLPSVRASAGAGSAIVAEQAERLRGLQGWRRGGRRRERAGPTADAMVGGGRCMAALLAACAPAGEGAGGGLVVLVGAAPGREAAAAALLAALPPPRLLVAVDGERVRDCAHLGRIVQARGVGEVLLGFACGSACVVWCGDADERRTLEGRG